MLQDKLHVFLAQHSVATLLRCCFELLQYCSNIATLCCESSRVTLPLGATAMTTASKSADLMSKKYKFTRVAHFFVHFFAVVLHD